MNSNNNTAASTFPTMTREELVAERKRLGRAMARETMSDRDFAALAHARDSVDAAITALDASK